MVQQQFFQPDINLNIFVPKYFIEPGPKFVLNAKCFTVLMNQTKGRAVTPGNLLGKASLEAENNPI